MFAKFDPGSKLFLLFSMHKTRVCAAAQQEVLLIMYEIVAGNCIVYFASKIRARKVFLEKAWCFLMQKNFFLPKLSMSEVVTRAPQCALLSFYTIQFIWPNSIWFCTISGFFSALWMSRVLLALNMSCVLHCACLCPMHG